MLRSELGVGQGNKIPGEAGAEQETKGGVENENAGTNKGKKKTAAPKTAKKQKTSSQKGRGGGDRGGPPTRVGDWPPHESVEVLQCSTLTAAAYESGLLAAYRGFEYQLQTDARRLVERQEQSAFEKLQKLVARKRPGPPSGSPHSSPHNLQQGRLKTDHVFRRDMLGVH